MPTLSLAHGLAFSDLYCRDGLSRIDAAFLSWLGHADPELASRLSAARAEPGSQRQKIRARLEKVIGFLQESGGLELGHLVGQAGLGQAASGSLPHFGEEAFEQRPVL